MHVRRGWKFTGGLLKIKPMSNASTAKILSRSQLYAAVFGEQPRPVTAFVFRWKPRLDGADKFVLVYGESEDHARGMATTKLEGIVGHSGFILGDRIEIV